MQRFGRNQRRRAREAIRAAEVEAERFKEAYQMEKGLLRYTAEKLGEAEGVIDEARYLLGDKTIALPPKHSVVHIGDGGFSLAVDSPVRLEQFMDDASVAHVTRKIERMHVLLASVDHDHQSQTMHMRVDIGGQEACYAISQTALRTAPTDWLVSRIGKEIARQIVPLLAGSARPCPRTHVEVDS